MNKYICHYNGIIHQYFSPISHIDATVEGKSLADFEHGFWIDSEGNLCKQSKGKFWIPPCRIYYVEKVVVEEG